MQESSVVPKLGAARMNNLSKPKGICRRSLLRSVPMIAGVLFSTTLRPRACSPKRRPLMKPPNIRIIQKTDSNAQVVNFSWSLIHARSWKIPSQRADGANSSQLSLPDAPSLIGQLVVDLVCSRSWGTSSSTAPALAIAAHHHMAPSHKARHPLSTRSVAK